MNSISVRPMSTSTHTLFTNDRSRSNFHNRMLSWDVTSRQSPSNAKNTSSISDINLAHCVCVCVCHTAAVHSNDIKFSREPNSKEDIKLIKCKMYKIVLIPQYFIRAET